MYRSMVDIHSASTEIRWGKKELEFGPMANVTAALQNISGALYSTLQSLANADYWSAVQ